MPLQRTLLALTKVVPRQAYELLVREASTQAEDGGVELDLAESHIRILTPYSAKSSVPGTGGSLNHSNTPGVAENQILGQKGVTNGLAKDSESNARAFPPPLKPDLTSNPLHFRHEKHQMPICEGFSASSCKSKDYRRVSASAARGLFLYKITGNN